MAAARIAVRAFRVVVMPAFAMDTVCCSITCEEEGEKRREKKGKGGGHSETRIQGEKDTGIQRYRDTGREACTHFRLELELVLERGLDHACTHLGK